MAFLTFGHDVLVFMEQMRGPLRHRLEPAILGTRKLAYQNRSCFVSCGGCSCLSIKVNVVKKAFGVTIQFVESFGNVGKTCTMVRSFLRQHVRLS